MANDTLLFEKCLRAVETGQYSLEQCIERYLTDRPEVEAALRVAVATRHVTPAEDDTEAARDRVRELLAFVMTDEESISHSERFLASIPQRRPLTLHWARWRRTRGLVAAATLLLVSSLLGWHVTDASAAALPGSPLYGVKRGQEWVALHTSWSDERRGTVLALLASRRLAEARAESELHHDTLVRSLTGECDQNVRQLIVLTAHMVAQHEDTTAVATGLATVLDTEYVTMHAAQQSGQSALAQSLDLIAVSEQQAIQQSSIELPAVSHPTPSQPGISTNLTPSGTVATPNGSTRGTGTTQSPSSQPGTNQDENGAGNGGGDHGSNGGGNGKHLGNGTATPTLSPTVTAPPASPGVPTTGQSTHS